MLDLIDDLREAQRLSCYDLGLTEWYGGVPVAAIRVQVREVWAPVREDRERVGFGGEEVPEVRGAGGEAACAACDPVQGLGMVCDRLRGERQTGIRGGFRRWRREDVGEKR
jgi:hypothetical protein